MVSSFLELWVNGRIFINFMMNLVIESFYSCLKLSSIYILAFSSLNSLHELFMLYSIFKIYACTFIYNDNSWLISDGIFHKIRYILQHIWFRWMDS